MLDNGNLKVNSDSCMHSLRHMSLNLGFPMLPSVRELQNTVRKERNGNSSQAVRGSKDRP